MLLHHAMSRNKNGNLEIDMDMIRKIAKAFDEGANSDEALLAKFVIAAYDAGFDHGVAEAEENHRRTAILMMCTAGNA